MADVILHNYPTSPFAEKIRLILGYKRIPWRSVLIPDVMPKPDLIALTGGYRRTPVLQIGADIYCDTHCIARVLEERWPSPSLYPDHTEALAELLAAWATRTFWPVCVPAVFGARADSLSESFLEDRAKLTDGRMTRDALKFVYPAARDQLRAQLTHIEKLLEQGRSHLLADAPSLADFSLAPLVAFLLIEPSGAAALAPHKRLLTWVERVMATGHGRIEEMDPKEAIEIARTSTPATKPQGDPGDPNGRGPGDRVQVVPDDYGRDSVEGELVASSDQEIAIRREDERAGTVVVHFPRAGFYTFSSRGTGNRR